MTWEPTEIGEWDEFWSSTDHDANEFESTNPLTCRHSAVRVAVLTEHTSYGEPVWAWVCRLCDEPMYEVPEVAP